MGKKDKMIKGVFMRKLSKHAIRAGIIIAAVAGLLVKLYPNKIYPLNYYTTLSNIAVLVFFAYLITHKESNNLLRAKGGVTIAILLTFIVYNVLLLPIVEPKDFYKWDNYTLHYIVPVLVTLDWAIYDKVRYGLRDPLYWTVFPLIYSIISLIKGILIPVNIPEHDSPFPYFFLDIVNIGWKKVLIYILAICIFYIMSGYIIYAVKNFLYRRKPRA